MTKRKPTKSNPKGAGRNLKYGEETVIAQTRVPKSKLPQFRKEVKTILNKWIKP